MRDNIKQHPPEPFWIAGITGLIFLGMLVGVLSYYYPVNVGNRVVTVIVEKGDSFRTVARELEQEGVISSQFLLKVAAVTYGLDRKLTPGRYDFTGRNSCNSVLKKLRKGDFVRMKITIPEGSTIWETAQLLAEPLELDSEYIVSLNTDSALLASLEIPCLEGYLYPETYHIPWGSNAEETIRLVVGQYYNMTDSIWPDTVIAGFSKHDIIKLASIIEAETNHGDERGLVSSVYHNRLKREMRLQADPTVIYGLGGLDRPLYKKDLNTSTPYNTYLKEGLPPTPINSPGLEAIQAALFPDSSDYLYFVADNSGRHAFSRTNTEHNLARQRIKEARNNMGSVN
jgi:UPF0755 protein